MTETTTLVAAAGAIDASKIYGGGDSEVRALDGVTVRLQVEVNGQVNDLQDEQQGRAQAQSRTSLAAGVPRPSAWDCAVHHLARRASGAEIAAGISYASRNSDYLPIHCVPARHSHDQGLNGKG